MLYQPNIKTAQSRLDLELQFFCKKLGVKSGSSMLFTGLGLAGNDTQRLSSTQTLNKWACSISFEKKKITSDVITLVPPKKRFKHENWNLKASNFLVPHRSQSPLGFLKTQNLISTNRHQFFPIRFDLQRGTSKKLSFSFSVCLFPLLVLLIHLPPSFSFLFAFLSS